MGQTSATRSRLRALDGLRGAAVLVVVLFHLGLAAFPGGLLGVDVFFVLSGFLITGLLLDERARTGRIDLRAFWVRRWRRLLPALLLTLVAVGLLAQWLSDATQVRNVRGEALATLFYVSNWQAVASGSSYFEIVSPSPLRHTWSLGVEEQFYVLWPVLVLAVFALRRSVRTVAVLAVVGAVLSAGAQVVLAVAGVGLDRLYFGTDTRVQALLVGAALAAQLAERRSRPQVAPPAALSSARGRRLFAAAGWAGAAGLAVLVLRVDGQAGWLYRGGFTLVALATAAVVLAAVRVPDGGLARVLAVRPLAYLGRISYGVYLAHWPVVVFLTPDRVALDRTGLTLLRAAVTLAVAVASFHLVEQPIRRHGLRLPRRLPGARLAVPVGVAGLVGALLLAPLPTSSPDTSLAAFQQSTPPPPPPVAVDEPTPTPSPRTLAPAVTRPGPLRVLLVGDSVAWTLGNGIAPAADPAAVTFTNQGFLGCGVARGTTRPLVQPEICAGWPDRWRGLVDSFRPDVTLLLPSVWDTFDRQRDGGWLHPGDPAYDRWMTEQYDLALRTLTARGGRLAVLGMPCVDTRLANGSGSMRVPEDVNTRLAALSADLDAALARYPGVTQRVAFDELLCPGGKFERRRDGRLLREADGTHLESYAGELFVRQQLPQVLRWVRTPVRR